MTIVAAIQMTSSHKLNDNLQAAAQLLTQAAQQQAKLVVLPENFAMMGLQPDDKISAQEPFGNGPIQQFLSDQARRYGIWIVAGTIPINADAGRVYNTCLVFDDHGNCIARYDKIHLFDVIINKGSEEYRESTTVKAGDAAMVIDSPVGKLGLSVCYDIRFPELFRLMFNQGAQIFTVPAAFTVPTGQAHWEILLRSRAIENFCYVIAAAQTGTHSNSRKTYGHSMIIDPWGKILTQLPEATGVITTDIDLDYLKQVRANIPVAEHQRIFTL